MKKLIAILIAATMVCAIAPMVGADPEIDTIVVTLTPGGTASIDVYNTSLGAGTAATWIPTVSIGGSANTGEDGFYSINNTGKVQVDVTIMAETDDDWTIGADAGHDTVNLQYNLTHIGDWTTITTGELSFLSNFPPEGQEGEVRMFDLLVNMPTSSSTNEVQTITITFEATPT